jgi:hypothetical protein
MRQETFTLSQQELQRVSVISACIKGDMACARRGIASNLYELGANDKVVQRILRHAKPHVTKERYIKAFDPAVLAAMKSLESSLDMLNDCSATVQQVN